MERFKTETIYWTEAYTTFGDLIFYGTTSGLMGIEFSTVSPPRQMKIIQKESFPQCELVENPKPLLEYLATAINYLQGKSAKLPHLLFRGTPLQISVWKELMRTKMGETLSYAELGARIGKPNAARAVASAVAKNRFAIIVPCHRVIRKDGSLGEYRWGAKRKRHLLQIESDTSPTN